jgi:polyether ionophore transport system permease protein
MGTAQAVEVRRGHVGIPAPATGRAVATLTTRLIRRGTIAIALGVGVMMVLEAFAFSQGYPDEASRAALTMWGRDPGIRMMVGQPIAVETVGGFAVWDAGLYLTLVLGAWALTTSARVLRGDEEHGRADLLLVGPIRPGRALAAQLLVLIGACGLVGAVVGLALAASGAQVWGSALYGALMVGYCATLVGLVGLACQVFETRVGALGFSGSVLVGWMLLRMVSNSQDSRAWLGWLTPTGWIDQMRGFEENRWWVLIVPLVAAAVLMAGAVGLREHRDSGAGILVGREGHRSRAWGLGSPLGFAWRAQLGMLLAWAAGIAVAALVVGAMLRTVDEFLAGDQGFIDLLAAMGMEVSDLTGGFVSMWAILLGLVIAVFSAFRMGVTRAEEASTRAEFLLTGPVRRWEWLGGHVLCLVASVLLLSLTAAMALWLGAVATGAPLRVGEAFAATFNAVPMIAVFAGLSVLVFGTVPRLTVVVGASAAVAAYVLEVVGPMLHWPQWVLAVSPFHHLAAVPVDAFALPATIVMVVIGTALAVGGIVGFQRRDLVGA